MKKECLKKTAFFSLKLIVKILNPVWIVLNIVSQSCVGLYCILEWSWVDKAGKETQKNEDQSLENLTVGSKWAKPTYSNEL